jgi:hypothetical protein
VACSMAVLRRGVFGRPGMPDGCAEGVCPSFSDRTVSFPDTAGSLSLEEAFLVSVLWLEPPAAKGETGVATDEVFVLREAYDRDRASDGRSRFGVYLRQHARYFDDEDGPTADRAQFAAAAFTVARVPIMSPPYVGTHPRVVLAEPVWDTDGRCGVLVGFAVPISERIADRLPVDTAGWHRDGDDGPYYASERLDRTAAYGQLVVRVPFPVELLPAPAYTDTSMPDVDTAKRAVRTICNHTNSLLAHLVTHLNTAGAVEPATSTALDRSGPY